MAVSDTVAFEQGGSDSTILDALSRVGVRSDGPHLVADACPSQFTWRYARGEHQRVSRLYDLGIAAQWSCDDLPWEISVDPEALVAQSALARGDTFGWSVDVVAQTALSKFNDADWIDFGVSYQRWMLSQFLHGEQGALLCSAKIVESAPWIDAKLYASTQVLDEARHVEVFSKYLTDKLEGSYPVNLHLQTLLDDIVSDARWDVTYLGMQIMVEGLALAAFGLIHATTADPLLRTLLRYVMADEARHVAFGVLSLNEVYGSLSSAELRERQEFALDAAIAMRDRFLLQEIWAELEIPTSTVVKLMSTSPERMMFTNLLFSRIIPNLNKLGLLDANDGWLRSEFDRIGVSGLEEISDAMSESDAQADTPPTKRVLS